MNQELQSLGLFAGVARWINPRGRRARSELVLLSGDAEQILINPEWLNQWLECPASNKTEDLPAPQTAKAAFAKAESEMENFIAGRCARNLLPDQAEWVSAAFAMQSTDTGSGG